MADNLTDTAENRSLDWILGGSPTAPVAPLEVALVTVLGDDATAGTEVVGGSYERKTLTVGSIVNGATSNSTDLVWTDMPACTVVGWEIWDSAGTPVRWIHAPVADQKVLAAGDDARFPAGSLNISIG